MTCSDALLTFCASADSADIAPVWRMWGLFTAAVLLPGSNSHLGPGYCLVVLVQSSLSTDTQGQVLSASENGLYLQELLINLNLLISEASCTADCAQYTGGIQRCCGGSRPGNEDLTVKGEVHLPSDGPVTH